MRSVNPERKQIELSFRSGDLKRDDRSQLTLSDLSEGQKVDGRVKKVEEYGIFIEIEGSNGSAVHGRSGFTGRPLELIEVPAGEPPAQFVGDHHRPQFVKSALTCEGAEDGDTRWGCPGYDLADAPEPLNEDPYGEGWIFVIETAGGAGELIDAAAYRALIEG